MPKKPVVATEEELQQAEARLTELIQKAKAEAAAATNATETKWQAAVQALQQKVDGNAKTATEDVTSARAEAKEYTEECVKQLNTQLLTFFPPIEARITEVHEDALKKLDETDTKIQQLIVDELSALAAQFDEEIKGLKTELTENINDMGRGAAEALVEQRRQIDECIEKLRLETMQDRALIREEVQQRFTEVLAEQRKRDQEQDDTREKLRREVYVDFDKVDDLIRQKEKKAHEHTTQIAADAEANRASLAEKNFRHLTQLDGETQQLREGLREVENVSTRRVEWVVKNASQVVKPPSSGWSPEQNDCSFYSSKFNGAGAWGMQFELRLYGPPSRRETDEAESTSGTGNLGVYLWACKGTRIAFKLYIGERAMPLEKRFTGRSPAGTGRLCWLKDQINKEDDTLRVGVEFLEAMREVEYPIRMPLNPAYPLTGRTPEENDGVMKALDALEGIELEATKPDASTLEGSMCYMRYLNHRVVDQVQQQVSSMESRMVRKIQWLVQNASKLRHHFPWGKAMCSPCFNAAGVENMQLALYPSGYGSVTDGFCSLFLYCPSGCTLHCFLSIDKQVRELQHTWDERGAFGRTNFCLFDKVIDLVDDTVLITLEIEEALQEVSTPWTHQEAATRKPESHQGVTADKDLSSITKLTKNPGKAPNGRPNGRSGKMDTAMTLASIWTAKAFVEGDKTQANVPEGFHSFDEVVSRRPMPVRSDSPGNKTVPRSPAGGVPKTESAPSLHEHGRRHDKGARTAMQEDLSPPLPPVSAGSVTLGATSEHWGSELPGGASSYGKARKVAARRQRPTSSGSTTRFSATQ
jgi:hypothetical protein